MRRRSASAEMLTRVEEGCWGVDAISVDIVLCTVSAVVVFGLCACRCRETNDAEDGINSAEAI